MKGPPRGLPRLIRRLDYFHFGNGKISTRDKLDFTVALEDGILHEFRLVGGKISFWVERTDHLSQIDGVVHGEKSMMMRILKYFLRDTK